MPRVVVAKKGEGLEDAAASCPVACFHKDPKTGRMVINPDECIDCGVCQSESKPGEIVTDDEASAADKKFNAEKSKEWPSA